MRCARALDLGTEGYNRRTSPSDPRRHQRTGSVTTYSQKMKKMWAMLLAVSLEGGGQQHSDGKHKSIDIVGLSFKIRCQPVFSSPALLVKSQQSLMQCKVSHSLASQLRHARTSPRAFVPRVRVHTRHEVSETYKC